MNYSDGEPARERIDKPPLNGLNQPHVFVESTNGQVLAWAPYFYRHRGFTHLRKPEGELASTSFPLMTGSTSNRLVSLR